MPNPGEPVESGKLCPRCDGVQLEAQPGEAFTFHRCARCGGAWFEGTTLDKAFRKTPPILLQPPACPPDPAGATQKRQCPSCKTLMIKVNSMTTPRVVMDVCKICGGKWLDGGEFPQMRGSGFFAWLRRLFGS
jgi:Zn-finger nucleic acid-binding protein